MNVHKLMASLSLTTLVLGYATSAYGATVRSKPIRLGGSIRSTQSAALQSKSTDHGGKSYLKVTPQLPAVIEASNYDLGGLGVGYHTNLGSNPGHVYRNDQVGLQESRAEGGNGIDLGWIQAHDWFNYTVKVPTAGDYPLSIAVASDVTAGTSAGSIHISDTVGKDLTGSINVPGTGEWQSWTTIHATAKLAAGTQTLHLYVDSASATPWAFNIAFMKFDSPGNASQAPPTKIPLTISYKDIGNGADPSVVNFKGEYWLAEGNASSQVTVYHATNYNDLLNSNGHHSTIQVNDRNFHSMAPGLSVVRDPSTGQDELVAYVTNGTAANGAAGQIVTFTMTDPAHASTNAVNHGAIPGVVGYDALQFTHPNGKSYLLTSQANRLNIVEMAGLFTTRGPTVTITTPTRAWEKPSYIVEAPAVAVSGNTLNIAYSTGRWENSTYKSGLLTASVNADPLNPNSYKKSENPIQQTGNGLVGPGSGTLFKDNDGNTIWCFDAVTGRGFSQRDIYTQKAYFNSAGRLVL